MNRLAIIPVEVRKPEPYKRVLIYLPNIYGWTVGYCDADQEMWRDEIGSCNPPPTHWMPLPDAPCPNPPGMKAIPGYVEDTRPPGWQYSG